MKERRPLFHSTMISFRVWFFLLAVISFHQASADVSSSLPRSSNLLENGLTRTIQHIYTHCIAKDRDIFWCFKVQGAKLLGRALKVQNVKLFEGVSIVKKRLNQTRSARASANELHLGNKDLEHLSTKSLNNLLNERYERFLQSRELEVNLPRLLALGQRNSQNLWSQLLNLFGAGSGEGVGGMEGTVVTGRTNEEARKKKGDNKYLGPFIAAVLLKAGILKMAYHSIAIVAGKALIVGKIALIISAIIGLKKLVSGDGAEKTTYEIVKHPQVQQSHTYSSSHTGEYEGGHEGGSGSYHRSIDDEMMMQDKAYRGWVPSNAA